MTDEEFARLRTQVERWTGTAYRPSTGPELVLFRALDAVTAERDALRAAVRALYKGDPDALSGQLGRELLALVVKR